MIPADPAHTILHEISHLDEFGKAALFTELTTPAMGKIPEYQAHSTDDWNGKTTAINARNLKTTTSPNVIPRWQNAERLAAFTLSMFLLLRRLLNHGQVPILTLNCVYRVGGCKALRCRRRSAVRRVSAVCMRRASRSASFKHTYLCDP